MGVEELEARIKNLEDIEAIKRLKGKYAYFADTKDVPGFMSLVADDAVWEFGPWGGRHEGKEAIRKFTEDVTLATYSFMFHNFNNISIDVKGDTATGIWYFLVPATNRKEKRAEWLGGMYEEKYVRVNGEWKFKEVVAEMKFAAPYNEGWFKK